MTVRFELYPEEQPWWSFADYQTVLNVMRRTGAKRVLEFGPGSSTLALLEGGAEHVDACEDLEEYARVWETRRAHPRVRLVRYDWSIPLSIPEVDGERYDLALIDGPKTTTLRPVALDYALERCAWVLMPTEEWHSGSGQWMRPVILEHAGLRPVQFMDTGPLSGAFALVGPQC